MKTIYLLLGCLCLQFNAYSQASSDETKVVVLVVNEKNQPVIDELLRIESDKLREPITEVTDAKGKAQITLPKNATYTISFENAVNHTKFTIEKDSRSLITKRLILEEKHQSPVSKSSESLANAADTIHFNLDKKATSYEHQLLAIAIFLTREEKPMPNLEVWVVSQKDKKVYHAITDETGAARFHLPRNQNFQVNLKDAPNYQQLSMPDIPNLTKRVHYIYSNETLSINETLNINETERNDTIYQVVPLSQKPTMQRVWLHVTVTDLDDKPLKGENVFMNASKGKTYTATTNSDGIALLMIPKGDTFRISFEYEPDVEAIYFPTGNYIRKDNVKYSYIGSAVIKKRAMKRLLALNERDSLYRIGALGYGITHDLDNTNLESIAKLISERATYERGEIKKDADFFEKREETVKAAFYRNLGDWRNKIIVTDGTGSMSPYWDQVMVWHLLQLTADERNSYVFFNDGDQKAMSEKVIGSTGGIYTSEATGMDAILKTIRQCINSGFGGESEENDIEALLKGIEMRKNNEEVILIADNYSDVRDMELLPRVNVPIRIILAGVDKTLGVHEHYLEIAYKTGGSIHTLEEDIFDLKKMLDGQSVFIGEFEYRVMRGKFIQVSKL
jgi:hypothetical protein